MHLPTALVWRYRRKDCRGGGRHGPAKFAALRQAIRDEGMQTPIRLYVDWERGRAVSIEREIFPQLIADGATVVGHPSDAYWRDLGTPETYLEATFDLLAGRWVGADHEADVHVAGLLSRARRRGESLLDEDRRGLLDRGALGDLGDHDEAHLLVSEAIESARAAGHRRVAVLFRILRKQFVGNERAVRTPRDDIGEGSPSIDGKVPGDAHRHTEAEANAAAKSVCPAPKSSPPCKGGAGGGQAALAARLARTHPLIPLPCRVGRSL